MTKKVAILGIPLDFNSSHLRGTAAGPEKIREVLGCGAMNGSSESGIDVLHHSDVKDVGNVSWNTQENAFPEIEKRINALLVSGQQVMSLGGDHSITFPIMSSYAKHYPSLTVLHFDAHADIYHDFEGNPHSHASPFARILENGLVKRLVQVGIRTITPHQQAQIDKFNVEVIEMKDWSLQALADKQLSGDVYVSIDLDGLDPSVAPGVSHHEPGGLLMREMLTALQALRVNVVGADIVEYNPRQDFHNHMTGFVAAKLLKECVAKML